MHTAKTAAPDTATMKDPRLNRTRLRMSPTPRRNLAVPGAFSWLTRLLWQRPDGCRMNEDDMDRTDSALLAIRMVLGLFLAVHGVNKVRSIKGTAGWFASIGMRWPGLQARTAAATEIVGGICLAVGFVFPLATAAVTATMVVAIVTVHRKVGFFIFLPNGGWEYCATIAVCASALSISGPGRASVDHALGVLGSTGAGMLGVILGFVAPALHLVSTWRPSAVEK